MSGSDDLISGFLAFNAHLGIQLQKRQGERLFCRLPYRSGLVAKRYPPSTDPRQGLHTGNPISIRLSPLPKRDAVLGRRP
ncbi:MAG: hypothetical protein GDA41_07610 [Rhodospirillales bacterium]|nr:hypothetical protein [Rhodospirillales bacterium]